MKLTKLLTTLAVSVLFGIIGIASADDIDIYVNPTNSSPSAPVVMFTLDYRSNLGNSISSCGFLSTETYEDAGGTAHPYVSSCTSFFDLLRGAMKYVLQQVGSSGVRIGIAMSHDNNNNCAGPSQTGCSNGGYIIVGAKPMTGQDQRDAFYAKLDAMPTPGGTVNHSYQGQELFFELFRYFSGQGWYNMKNGWKDRGTNNTYNVNDANDYSPADASVPLSWDTSIVSGANYVSPVTDQCTKIYTVNIMFQVSAQENDSNSAIIASSGGMNGVTQSGQTLNYAGLSGFPAVIRWMYDNDNNTSTAGEQNVISYFVVDPTKVNSTTRSYAGAGVGVSSADPYTLSNDPQEMVDTLTKIFRNVLSVSTTFVAPSVAVNVYNRSQVLDDVYIAMFQADPDGFPGWNGNLKKYALGLSSSKTEELQDVTDTFAVAADGRIKFGAMSYWTIAADLPAAPSGISDIITGKDGRIVYRGGAGSKIPGYKLNCTSTTDTSCYPGSYTPGLTNPGGNTTNISTRKVFYDDPTNTSTTNTGLGAFNANTTTATALQSLLGASSVGTCDGTDTDATSACNLIAYGRGVYFINSTDSSNKARTWLINDLLHSRPLAINYGARASGYTTTNPDIRIVAGSNDGFMHMFRNTKANQADPKTPNDMDGVETWAFIPREIMPVIETLKTNAGSPMTPPHPYSVDGAPSVLVIDVNGDGNIDPSSCDSVLTSVCDKVYLYFGLRRGGKAYYAMDITDPDNPKFLWKITPTTNSSGATSSDFAEMGQTWSTPKVTPMLFNGNTVSKPVLVFGGGYDTNKDTHIGHKHSDTTDITTTEIGTDDSVGNAIFIIDAETGALVWKAAFSASATSPTYDSASKTYKRDDMKDSIPSDVTVVDSDGNGLADRLYVGDTGGVLWRVDTRCRNQDGSGTVGTTPLCPEGGWKATPIMSVGRHYDSTLANDRRFFYPPAYVQAKDSNNTAFDALLIGSGDRENPRNPASSSDTSITNWFYMYKDTATTSGTPPASTSTHAQLTDVTCTLSGSSTCQTVGATGWRIKLECPNLFSNGTGPTLCGEKSLSAAVALGSKIFFTTYIPSSASTDGTCGLNEGTGLLYAVNLLDGGAVEDFDPTNNTSTQTLFGSDRYTQLSSKGIPSEVVSLGGGKYLRPDLKVGDAGAKTGYKTFWYDKGK